MQRVSAIRGSVPAIVVVPHGNQQDDTNTAIIGEQIIKEIDSYGVINYGWKRADKYDYDLQHANCNDIRHIQQDVVKEEFLEPLVRYAMAIERSGYIPNIYILHGVSNEINKEITYPHFDATDIILGYGNGDPPLWSCDQWVLFSFAELLNSHHYNVALGKANGRYAGKGIYNLNQLFKPVRSNTPYVRVQSMQLEIVRKRRDDEVSAKITGNDIAMCIEDNLERQQNWKGWAKHNYYTKYRQI